MNRRKKATILVLLGAADLTCFALGGLEFGEIWSGLGVMGLLVLLALFEFL